MSRVERCHQSDPAAGWSAAQHRAESRVPLGLVDIDAFACWLVTNMITPGAPRLTLPACPCGARLAYAYHHHQLKCTQHAA